MKNLMAKIWVPTLIVLLAAVQSFGIDLHRSAKVFSFADSLALISQTDSTRIDSLKVDSLASYTQSPDTLLVDSLAIDTLQSDTVMTLFLTARDTIKVPDSLREADPFFYKYYIAVKDSTTRAQVRDSLLMAGDTLELMKLDSLYLKDSSEVAKAKFDAWYASLSRMERKKYDNEQRLPALIAAANRKAEIKDSIQTRKDSIRKATPRILETFAVPDSMHYKRLIMWKHDRYFHNIALEKLDTSFNYNFTEYPFYKKDVNATYLGVIGSPAQLYNYFKREEIDNAIFYTPYELYTYTPETLPKFNTKTPYTELCYWGTLFANKEKEESSIRVRTTQNITPQLNIFLEYSQFGSKGMLRREDTDNRTAVMAANYLGKRYMMHTGYIYNRIERSENGGVIDTDWIRDTTVDSREIEVYLRNASNKLKKNTLFLDQTYRIPFTFLDKNVREAKKREKIEAARRDSIKVVRDSILAGEDSLAIAAVLAEIEKEQLQAAQPDQSKAVSDSALMNSDITTAFIGHSSEYSVFRKTYEDNITDDFGREFYGDRFYINPTHSKDSLRVMRFENRVFIRLQPWKSDGIISKLDIGVGDKLANYFTFKPIDYLEGSSNKVMNSMYIYSGARGQYDKYLEWDAFGKYTFLGYEVNDFTLNANANFKIYPFRKDRKSPIEFKGHFETSLKEPDYYQQHLFTNHFKWDNDFGKISTTKVEGGINIPRWDMEAAFGYALLANNIYYDTLGIVRQNTKPMSVMSTSLRKDFQVGKLHFENRALFQLSSDKDVMPLPMLALNLRYYFEFDVVKNAMRMQIGANTTFTTKWYAPAYNPVLGVFHNQNKEEFGNCPYIDAFVNVQWKRACVFVKAVNVNMGWPNESADYFTAAGYIAPQRVIKLGITWPFYTLPGRGGTTSSKGSAGAGSGMGPSGGSRPGMGSSSGPRTATNSAVRR